MLPAHLDLAAVWWSLSPDNLQLVTRPRQPLTARMTATIARPGDKMSYQKCKWKRLGYLSLDNNERSSWQARELKSVQVHDPACWLEKDSDGEERKCSREVV